MDRETEDLMRKMIEAFGKKIDEIQAVVLTLPGRLDHLEFRINSIQTEKAEEKEALRREIRENAEKIEDLEEFKEEVERRLSFMRGVLYTVGGLVTVLELVPKIIQGYKVFFP